MEAVWTRYFPLSIYVRHLITSHHLGTIHRVSADLSMSMSPESSFPDDAHRMVNPALAGGALLDLGIYALTWCFQTLYTTQDPSTRKPPTVASAMQLYRTGADEMTTILLTFPRSKEQGGDAHAIATTALRVATDPDGKSSAGPAVRIQGDKGEVQIFHPMFRPTKTKVVLTDGTVEEKDWPQPGPGKGSGWENGFGESMRNAEGEGHGMFWEADEAGMALLEGRKEGKFEGLEESVLIMEVMDEVRRQGGLKYPEGIESTEFPVEL
jgi:dihydrodiol dehydrogenase / D-xylose 1-dehydrogenase (NADP)